MAFGYQVLGFGSGGGVPPATSVSGGTETSTGGYTYHTFTSSGTFTTNGTLTVNILVVGGGGGAGYWGGCGGGGGSVYQRTDYAMEVGASTVTIGAGGASKTGSGGGAAGAGVNGVTSKLGTLHFGFGGGQGGAAGSGSLNSGGNGGGQDDGIGGDSVGLGITDVSASATVSGETLTADHKTYSFSTTPTLGDASSHNGSGGGGAGGLNGTWSAPSTMTSPGHGGNGGIGKNITWATASGTSATNTLSGTRGYYGGGGHGLASNTLDSVPGGADESGIANTGGGAAGDKLGNGGSGIVIIRYTDLP